MAAPEPKSASRRLLDAAASERVALEADLSALEERRRSLHAELRALEVAEREMRRRLLLVDEIAGDHTPRALRAVPEGNAGDGREVLGGARIRIVAGQIVAAKDDRFRPRHYTDWFEELLDAGYTVTGRDPLAGFLTQLGRSPAIRREAEPGMYRLDFTVISDLEQQLLQLNEMLARLQLGQQTIAGISSVREERERIVRSIDQVERTLVEALTTLHPLG